jgi:hypothetical protein
MASGSGIERVVYLNSGIDPGERTVKLSLVNGKEALQKKFDIGSFNLLGGLHSRDDRIHVSRSFGVSETIAAPWRCPSPCPALPCTQYGSLVHPLSRIYWLAQIH